MDTRTFIVFLVAMLAIKPATLLGFDPNDFEMLQLPEEIQDIFEEQDDWNMETLQETLPEMLQTLQDSDPENANSFSALMSESERGVGIANQQPLAALPLKQLLQQFKDLMKTIKITADIQAAKGKIEALLNSSGLLKQVYQIWNKGEEQAVKALDEFLERLLSQPQKIPAKLLNLLAKIRQIGSSTFTEIKYVIIQGGYSSLLGELEKIYFELQTKIDAAAQQVIALINDQFEF